MFTTKTGNFPIGFRRGWSEWQQDLATVLNWAKENDLSVVDLGDNVSDLATLNESGVTVGSVDALDWGALLSSDPATRAAGVEKNAAYVTQSAALGAKKFFIVMLPEDPAKPRRENFENMVESLNALAPTLEANGAQLVIEGYPGDGALCCTPETYRATFQACPSPSIGINYDPSHLLRMGIDPIRFLEEFAARVGHVHGKDAEILADDLYEYGWEQPATFKESPAFGSTAWRYTIPGKGNTNWDKVFAILAANGYQGAVSIELEDKDYNGSEAGEKTGILEGAKFLSER